MNTPAEPGTVTIVHPHAGLLYFAAVAYNKTLAGRWGVAAALCVNRLTDPVSTAAVLDDIGTGFAVPDFERLTALVPDGFEPIVTEVDSISFSGSLVTVTSALDLFMRILMGQWNEMRYHCVSRRTEGFLPDVDLTALRARESRPYDDTVPWDERSFPPHPNASISIAQAPLAAQVAYHAYKELGAGAPGSPTFTLPGGPLRVEIA